MRRLPASNLREQFDIAEVRDTALKLSAGPACNGFFGRN
jgi:hypothetical protein